MHAGTQDSQVQEATCAIKILDGKAQTGSEQEASIQVRTKFNVP